MDERNADGTGDETGQKNQADGQSHAHREDHDDEHKHDPGDDHEHDDVHEHDDDHEHKHKHDPGDDHDHHHHDVEELAVAIVTVSTSREMDQDLAGDSIAETIETAGHSVSVRELINDDFDTVQNTVNRLVSRGDTDCVVTTGGTGVTPDDVTVEAVEPIFDKRLPGFGELFRSLSREEIGTRVVGTRATAGIADGAPVFCLPGSVNAARLGTEAIVVEEAPHLAGLARRDDPEDESETEE